MRTRASCLVFALVVLSPNASSQWTQTNGPYEGNVTRFAVGGADSFVETGGFGVFLSTNNGTSWTAGSTALTDTRFLSLAVSGENFFARTNSGGVCRSTNSVTGRTSAVLTDSSATDSSAADIRGNFFLFPSMGYSKDTYVPSFGGAARSGVYFLEIFLPVAILARDPYNGNKVNISFSALIPLAAGIVVSVLPRVGLGKVLTYIILVPINLANSQHHLLLVGPNGLIESAHLQLRALAGCRTDCYNGDVEWDRWTPVVALQLAFDLKGEGEVGASKWLALCGGIEAPVDFVKEPHSMPSQFFISLKYYLPQSMKVGLFF